MDRRIVNGVLNYTGSKFKLLEQILPEFDYTKPYFVDLFCGGGSVFSNVLDKYNKILANDILKDVIGIHKQLFENPNEIIDSVKKLATCKDNQEKYNQLREDYNNNNTPEKLFALILSCTNNMLRYSKSGKMNQTWGKRGFNDSTEKKLKLYLEHISGYQNKVIFSSRDFFEINLKKSSMVYIDSPYTGSEAGYSGNWNSNDDIRLYKYCKILDNNNNSFMLSGILGEHKKGFRWELIDKLISDGYRYKILKFDYEKVARNKNTKNSQEVIIMNY